MNQPATQPALSETQLVLLYLAKKLSRIALRWILCLSIGVLAWVLFDPLPAGFLWFVIIAMLGSMSIHTVLHRKPGASPLAKLACRYAFFLSFPLLFIFAGNRFAVWSVSADTVSTLSSTGAPNLQGVVPSEEYLIFKELKKEGFKDPVKTKKGFRKIIGNQLARLKEMDKGARIALIIIGAILLLVVLFLIWLVYAVNDSTDSCLDASTGGSSSDTSCCM